MQHTQDRHRLYHKVAAELATRISAGDFAKSERLPTERTLADMLSVSRTTVREALLSLKLRGIIEIRGGSGIYLAKNNQSSSQLDQIFKSVTSPVEVLEIRIFIEVELAALAAEKATDEQIEDIQAAVDWGWRDFKNGQYRHEDLTDDPDGRFHFAIAQAAQNNTSACLVKELWKSMRSPLTQSIESLVQIEQYAELSMLDHERILQKIKQRDASGARDAMHRHLSRYLKIVNWEGNKD